MAVMLIAWYSKQQNCKEITSQERLVSSFRTMYNPGATHKVCWLNSIPTLSPEHTIQREEDCSRDTAVSKMPTDWPLEF